MQGDLVTSSEHAELIYKVANLQKDKAELADRVRVPLPCAMKQ